MSKDIPRNRSETASSIGKLLTDRSTGDRLLFEDLTPRSYSVGASNKKPTQLGALSKQASQLYITRN